MLIEVQLCLTKDYKETCVCCWSGIFIDQMPFHSTSRRFKDEFVEVNIDTEPQPACYSSSSVNVCMSTAVSCRIDKIVWCVVEVWCSARGPRSTYWNTGEALSERPARVGLVAWRQRQTWVWCRLKRSSVEDGETTLPPRVRFLCDYNNQ